VQPPQAAYLEGNLLAVVLGDAQLQLGLGFVKDGNKHGTLHLHFLQPAVPIRAKRDLLVNFHMDAG
jgi:hypothetical protein